MKNIFTKKKLYILFIWIGLSLITFGIYKANTTRYNEVPEEFKNIEYSMTSYCSCLSFYDNNEFGEYDCDSEPTDMPFSGEFYDKYEYYSNGKIIFKGKGQKPIHAKILSWDKEKLVIKVLGSKQLKRCTTNNKDIYEYYLDSTTYKGKELKEYLKEINSDNSILLTSWDETGNHICTKEVESECVNSKIITPEEFYAKLKDNKIYDVGYTRDENGKIESIQIIK